MNENSTTEILFINNPRCTGCKYINSLSLGVRDFRVCKSCSRYYPDQYQKKESNENNKI
jgi:hypothetical protein